MSGSTLTPVQLSEYHQGEMGDDNTEIISSDQLAEDDNQFTQSTASSLGHSMEATIADQRRSDRAVIRRNALAMFTLTFINLLNYIDRYSIAGILSEIIETFGINDRNAGLIQTSFIISYMLLSPLFGYLGDRYKRKYIMAAGIGFWSIFTLSSSFVKSFELFLLMRALVGVGEASYSTIAPTIIADLFVDTARTKALTVFYFAIPVGSGLGYIMGSKVSESLSDWRWALRVTPGLGIVCIILILLLVVEPRRGSADNSQHLEATSYISDLKYLARHKSFILSSAGFTCVAFVAGALALWAPLYIQKSIASRPEYVNKSTVSMIFGLITCVSGIVGVMLGSFSASKLRRYTKKADPFVCAFGLLASSPFLYFSLVVSRYNTIVTWILILLGETLLCLNWALITDMLLYLVIPTRRSTAEAIQILMSHILGDAGSPFLIGIIADAVMGDKKEDPMLQYLGLQYALFTTAFVCVLGGAFFLFTSIFIDSDRKAAERIISGSRQVNGSISSLASDNSDLRSGAIPPNSYLDDDSIIT